MMKNDISIWIKANKVSFRHPSRNPVRCGPLHFIPTLLFAPRWRGNQEFGKQKKIKKLGKYIAERIYRVGVATIFWARKMHQNCTYFPMSEFGEFVTMVTLHIFPNK